MKRQIPKEKGEEAEKFIAKIFRAHKSSNEAYDLVNKTSLIEVKSCEALHPDKRECFSFHLGRFTLITENHRELLREAHDKKKKPVYVFVLRVDKYKLFKKYPAQLLKVPSDRKHFNVSWGKIFYEDLDGN